MKKIGFLVTLCLVIIGIFVFVNKLYSPSVPIESMSKKELTQIIKDAVEKIVPLTEEEYTQWFIVLEKQQDNVNAIVQLYIAAYDWQFKEQLGSGLIFEREKETLIVTTEKWTSDYSLVKVPTYYKQ